MIKVSQIINSFLYTTLLYDKSRVVYKKSWWFMRITMLKKKIHCADKAQLHAESAEKSPTSFFDFVMPHETSINAALYLAHGKWWLYLNGIIHWGAIHKGHYHNSLGILVPYPLAISVVPDRSTKCGFFLPPWPLVCRHLWMTLGKREFLRILSCSQP